GKSRRGRGEKPSLETTASCAVPFSQAHPTAHQRGRQVLRHLEDWEGWFRSHGGRVQLPVHSTNSPGKFGRPRHTRHRGCANSGRHTSAGPVSSGAGGRSGVRLSLFYRASE